MPAAPLPGPGVSQKPVSRRIFVVRHCGVFTGSWCRAFAVCWFPPWQSCKGCRGRCFSGPALRSSGSPGYDPPRVCTRPVFSAFSVPFPMLSCGGRVGVGGGTLSVMGSCRLERWGVAAPLGLGDSMSRVLKPVPPAGRAGDVAAV